MHRYHYIVGLAWSLGLFVRAIIAVCVARQCTPCRCSRGLLVAAVLFWKDLRCAGTRLMPRLPNFLIDVSMQVMVDVPLDVHRCTLLSESSTVGRFVNHVVALYRGEACVRDSTSAVGRCFPGLVY